MLLILIVVSVCWRLIAPTEPTWRRFPLYGDGVICQNVLLWLAGRCYGEEDVHNALKQASRHLREDHPGARVAYMDVGKRGPGRLWPHRSHDKGVDVDVLFIGRKKNGEAYPGSPSLFSVGYSLNYEKDGQCGSLNFDAKANWRFLEGLHGNEHRRIEKIFVEPYIEAWLLDAGRELGAPAKTWDWAANVLRYAGDHAADHKDHFHIRFREE